MTGNERFDDSIGNWLQAAAPDRLPQRVLEATFERTRRTRQGRAWRAVLGTRRVTQMAPALAGAAVVVAAVVAVSVIPSLSPAATPSPSPSATLAPSTSPVAGTPVWPQTSLEEARQAQALADAGDRNYTWQVSPRWVQPGQHHPMSLEFFDRFLKEKLGWDNATWDEAFAHREGLKAGDVIFVRCGPDGTNPLYPNDPAHPLCAPTLDDYRYETVKVHVTQPVKEGEAGIFVVTGWEMIEPAVQVAPPSDAEIAASLGAFLRARVDGAGAEGLVDFDTYDDPLAGERVSQEIPLLYATSDGAPYKRSEFEVVDRPEVGTDGAVVPHRIPAVVVPHPRLEQRHEVEVAHAQLAQVRDLVLDALEVVGEPLGVRGVAHHPRQLQPVRLKRAPAQVKVRSYPDGYPTSVYLVSWMARIFNLKNPWSRNPYACRFIVLILLFVPSIGPLVIITS